MVGIAILYSYAMFQGGFVSWFLLFSFLPFILYSLLLVIYPFRFWKIDRVIGNRSVYESGDTVMVEITINRKIPFPIYFLMIEEKLPSRVGFNQKIVLFPLFKRRISLSYEINQLPRGEHIFKEIKITTMDFLGFIKKEHIFKVESTILVYPKLQRLSVNDIDKSLGEGTSARGLNNRKETMVLSGVREYQPGDRLSWINWKMTAKRNNPMTKEFEITENQQMMIYLDRFNEIHSSSFEKMVHFTASLVNELDKSSKAVNLVSVGNATNLFTFDTSSNGRRKLLYHLAVVKNDSPIPLAEVLQKTRSLQKKGTIVIVTNNIHDDLINVVKRLANDQYRIVFMVANRETIPAYYNQFSNQNMVFNAIDERLNWKRLR